MSESSRTEVLDYLFSAQTSSVQCERDILLSSEKQIVYNLDYSSFFNGIWPQAEKRSIYDAVSGEFYGELISSDTIPYSPIITSITFFEILETLYDEIEALKQRSRFILDRIKIIHSNIDAIRRPAGEIEASFPLTQSQIQAELDKLRDATGGSLRSAATRASNLLGKNGQVRGMGDIIGPAAKNIVFSQSQIDSLFDEMWDYRSAKDSHGDVDKREFRYMVDVINIYLTKEINRTSNHMDVNYVSKANYTSKFSPDHGRSPLVPLFWLRAHRNQEFGNLIERADFFASLSRDAEYVYKRFFSRDVLPDPGDLNFTLFDNFNKMFMGQLKLFRDYRDVSVDPERDKLFVDQRYIKATLEKNVSESESVLSRMYKDFGGLASDGLIEKSGIERLAYFRNTTDRIRKKFSK